MSSSSVLSFASARKVAELNDDARVINAAEFAAPKQCPAVVVVERDSHERLKMQALKGTNETGGPFIFQRNDETGGWELRFAETPAKGQFAKVDIPRGVVECHTHPATCRTNTCTVALPSAPDMVNIVIGVRDGVQAHLLYCADGVYVIQVSPALRKVAQATDPRSICRLQHTVCEINGALDGVMNEYTAKAESSASGAEGSAQQKHLYATYQKRWLDKARELGFDITLVPYDEQPAVPVQAPCDVASEALVPLVTLDTRWAKTTPPGCDATSDDRCAYLRQQLASIGVGK
jgi:hypothetical protein